MSAEVPIPFYGPDGEHVITLSIELDVGGQPSSSAEVIGPHDTGSRVHVLYRPDECPGQTPPWLYTEIDHIFQPPEPGSDDVVGASGPSSMPRLNRLPRGGRRCGEFLPQR